MDLKSGYPFWAIKNGLMTAFPALATDAECAVAIVGGGITGALTAYTLTQAGIPVCVIDRRDVAWGSTSASTALLQYEIDTELQDLAELYGLTDATLAYQACADAIGKLGKLAGKFRAVEFQPQKSLYYASHWHHRSRLIAEGQLRQAQGFAVEILERAELRARTGVDASAALLSHLGAAMDPYQMAHALLRAVRKAGGLVYDHTKIESFTSTGKTVILASTGGQKIRADYLVFAGGYENERYLTQKVAENRSSYAYITNPIATELGVLEDTMVWESARPYLYMRRTKDRRILIGGEDDSLDIPAKRDALVAAKAKKLRKKVEALFPELDLTPAFAWAGTFAETKDGLPFFGAHEEHGKRVLFAMAYGGNGITYSQIGAEILLATVSGKRHPLSKLFSFKRLDRR